MKLNHVFVVASRVMRQIIRDKRTVGLLVFVPILAMTLGAIIFRADPATIPLGVVNEDRGLSIPMKGKIKLGELIIDELEEKENFKIVEMNRGEIDDFLQKDEVEGVVVIPEDFSAEFQKNQQGKLDLRLEGSDPTRSKMIIARVTESANKALAGLAIMSFGIPSRPVDNQTEAKLPINLEATYLYAGEEFDTMDFIAPVYIGFLVMFFVFLLTTVSFLRERSQGTMERLLATPVTRLEIVLGYMGGLGLFAFAQVAVILLYTILVLQIHYLGSLGLLFLVTTLLAVVGVSMGILASAFARNEFQVVQFIPLVIIPQALLSGILWEVKDMPSYLQPFAYLLPLTYANMALRDVMLKGRNLIDIWPNLAIMLLIIASLIALGAITMRREIL